jgi:hypothetical protein
MEPAIGFRGWRTGGTGLFSLTKRAYWQPRQTQRAQCGLEINHRPPAPECSCGLYAVYDVGGRTVKGISAPASDCLGAVRCWGRLVLHPEGFRAEFAAILGLYVPPSLATGDAAEPFRSIAEAYAVPIFFDLAGLRTFALEFGVNYAPSIAQDRRR